MLGIAAAGARSFALGSFLGFLCRRLGNSSRLGLGLFGFRTRNIAALGRIFLSVCRCRGNGRHTFRIGHTSRFDNKAVTLLHLSAAKFVPALDVGCADIVFLSYILYVLAAAYDVGYRRYALGSRHSQLVVLIGIGALAACRRKIPVAIDVDRLRGLVRCSRLDISSLSVKLGVVSQNGILAHEVAQNLLARQCQHIRTIVARNNIFAELRIQHSDLVDRNIEDIGYLLKVDAMIHGDSVSCQVTAHDSRRDIVVVVEIHHIVGGDERRHISAGFARQIVIDFPEIFLSATGTAKSLVDIARAAVVGGNRQRPVAVDVVKLMEIAGGVARRCTRITTLIDKRVDLHAEPFCSARHELPETTGAGAADGIGVQRALDNRQILQLGRHPFFQEFLKEYIAVVAVESEHIGHKAATLAKIHIDHLSDNIVIGHLYLGRQRGKTLLIVFGRSEALRLIALVAHDIVLEIEIFLKLADFRLEAFRRHDIVVGQGMFDVENRLRGIGRSSGHSHCTADNGCG